MEDQSGDFYWVKEAEIDGVKATVERKLYERNFKIVLRDLHISNCATASLTRR